MNKKMAREIVESLPSLYPLMTADEEEAIWTVLATNSNAENDGNYISRQQAIDAICSVCGSDCDKSKFIYNAPQDEQVIMCPEHYALSTLPSTQPDNQVHLCDSCLYTYPECPSVYTDMIFGNGRGNDNICACSKYLPLIKHDTDTISRQAVIDTIDEWKEACADSGHKETASDITLIRKDFIDLPSVMPKQAEGEWIPHKSKFGGDDEPVYTCNKCGDNIGFRKRNFCPNCGAKLEGVNNEND